MITLTLRTWLTFFALAILMGLNNIYSTLLTGWGEGGSIVAVILSLLFLAKNERNILNYNLGQTMASAGGSVGFAVSIIASIYYLEPGWNPPLIELSIMVMGLSVMGVAFAAPLRRTIVHWFFPSAVACATILKAVTSENLRERIRARNIMGVSGLLSALLTVPTKAAFKPNSGAVWHALSLPGGLSLSFDPLLYGIGIVVGPRIGISMLIGGLLNFFVFSPNMGSSAADFSRWAAVGMMTLPAFTSVVFALFLKRHGPLPPGFKPTDSGSGMSNKDWIAIGLVFMIALTATMLSMQSIFKVSYAYVALAAFIAAPLCFALGKVASETDINPVRLLAIILLMIFSLTGSFGAVALLGIAISGAAMAAIAVDLFYDLRTGYLINAKPRQQIFVQFLAVVPVSLATVFFLHMLAQNFGFGEGKYFPAPAVIVWASMAELFAEGTTGITPLVWKTVGYTSIIGTLMTLIENSKKFQRYALSPFAMGIAFLMPIEMSCAICLGSLIRHVFVSLSSNGTQAKEDAFQAGSAIFAASALAGIITVILISMGVFYLPN